MTVLTSSPVESLLCLLVELFLFLEIRLLGQQSIKSQEQEAKKNFASQSLRIIVGGSAPISTP